MRPGTLQSYFTTVGISKNADCVAAVDNLGNVVLLHIRRNRFSLLSREGKAGTSVAFGVSNEVYAAFTDNVIRVYDKDTGVVLATLKGHRSRITHIEVGPGGVSLLSTSADAVFLWDAKGTYRRRSLNGGPHRAFFARFAGESGDRVIVGFCDDSMWVWTKDSCELISKLHLSLQKNATPDRRCDLCKSISVSSNGRYVITTSNSTVLCLWNITSSQLEHCIELPAAINHGSGISFIYGGSAALCACVDGTLRVVDPFNGVLTHTIKVQDNTKLNSVSMSVESAGRYAAVVTGTSSLRLYDLHILCATRQDFHPRKLQLFQKGVVATKDANASDADLKTAYADNPMSTATPSPPQCDSILESIFSPLNRKCFLHGDDARLIVGKATFSNQRGSLGAPPGRRTKLTKARCGPGCVAKAAPASSHAAARFPLPDIFSVSEVDVHQSRGGTRAVSSSGNGAHPILGGSREKQVSAVGTVLLRNLLYTYGEYPRNHRLAMWRKLLSLPNNEEAYAALLSKGTHPAFAELPRRFPTADRLLLARLRRVASALAHWSPICAEAVVVPGMLFPFVRTCRGDEVFAFEALATVLHNHTRNWFSYFPDPPFVLLNKVNSVVQNHDPELAHHLETFPGGLHNVAWQLLSTLFTDVTTADEWLQLFDHILTNGSDMLLYLTSGFIITWRDTFLNAQTSSITLPQLFIRESGVNVPRLLGIAYELRDSTPLGSLTADSNLSHAESVSVSETGLTSFFVIPKGSTYPVFEDFPLHALKMTLDRRERVCEDEHMLISHQNGVTTLSRRTDELHSMEMGWESEAAFLAASEDECKSIRVNLQRTVYSDLKHSERTERAIRLRQLEMIEGAYQAALRQKKNEWISELEKLRTEVNEQRESLMVHTKINGEKDRIHIMEGQTRQRLMALESELRNEAELSSAGEEVTEGEFILKNMEKETVCIQVGESQNYNSKTASIGENRDAVRALTCSGKYDHLRGVRVPCSEIRRETHEHPPARFASLPAVVDDTVAVLAVLMGQMSTAGTVDPSAFEGISPRKRHALHEDDTSLNSLMSDSSISGVSPAGSDSS